MRPTEMVLPRTSDGKLNIEEIQEGNFRNRLRLSLRGRWAALHQGNSSETSEVHWPSRILAVGVDFVADASVQVDPLSTKENNSDNLSINGIMPLREGTTMDSVLSMVYKNSIEQGEPLQNNEPFLVFVNSKQDLQKILGSGVDNTPKDYEGSLALYSYQLVGGLSVNALVMLDTFTSEEAFSSNI